MHPNTIDFYQDKVFYLKTKMARIPRKNYKKVVKKELLSGLVWRDAASELLATFLFVSGVVYVIPTPNDAPKTEAALAAAFVWTSVSSCFAPFGGAHMNPAITFAMVLRMEITITRALLYWVVQISGSIFGVFFVYKITPQSAVGILGSTVVADGLYNWQAFLIEFWITTVLCLTYVITHNMPPFSQPVSSLMTGLSVGMEHFIALHSTGAGMNPARSVGSAVAYDIFVDNEMTWTNHWIYWIAPLLGGLFAVILVWIAQIIDFNATKEDNISSNEPGMFMEERADARTPAVPKLSIGRLHSYDHAYNP